MVNPDNVRAGFTDAGPVVSRGSITAPKRMDDSADFFNAVRAGSIDRVRSLLGNAPQLVHARSEGATALHFAAIANDRPMVDLLLAARADVNARDETYQMTPIGWANEEGHGDMVRHLYDCGAEVDLHRAASYGLVDHVKDMVRSSRRQVNALVGGWTPLQLATLWGHIDVVKLLLTRGADPLVRDPFGRTALEVARAQVESNAKGTPLVREEHRREIVQACARIAELLEQRGPR
jgi:ankyrin repeat protein